MFEDGFGGRVKVTSSTLTPGSFWVFIKHGEYNKYTGALHVNKQQAQDLVDQLTEAFNGSS